VKVLGANAIANGGGCEQRRLDGISDGRDAEEERMRISEDRKRLLLVLEDIIGNECYNAKIQNWGPHGVFEAISSRV